jgi:putative drug exporter of the RND superfamily
VCIALLGMLALGVSFLSGLAVGAAVGVAATVLAALTLLPALLGFIGPRVLSRRQRRTLATDGPAELPLTGFWSRWALVVQRRPVVPVAVALVIIGTLASPFFSLRLGTSDQGNDPVGTTTRTAYDMLATGFGPGFNGPLQLVAEVPTLTEPGLAHRVVAGIASQPDVARVESGVVPAKQGNDVLLVNVYPKTSPQSAATTDLINHLRISTIPTATAESGVDVYVGGQTATFVDFDHVISDKLPLFHRSGDPALLSTPSGRLS